MCLGSPTQAGIKWYCTLLDVADGQNKTSSIVDYKQHLQFISQVDLVYLYFSCMM